MIRRFAVALTLVSLFALASGSHATGAAAQQLPDHFSDAEFWTLINDVSEPGGTFRSDNFLSNERQYQWVIPDLQRVTTPGGVYLGVGPEQNFTYIVALRPRLAIIFDIRRQNMIEHLMYKALFENSANRSEFLSKLFCRAPITRFDTTARIDSLALAYRNEPADTALGRATLAQVKTTLSSHGFTLTTEDLAALDYVHNAFCDVGLALDYGHGAAAAANGGGFSGRGGYSMPNYHDLAIATDEAGVQRGYLATEANYRYMKTLEAKNVIVPVVGDFAGPRAIRTVGQYLKDHNATVMAFYASNVEQYLFQQRDNWKAYYENVATLPLDSTSQFIRSRGGSYRDSGTRASVIASITELLQLYRDGRILSYGNVLNLAH